MPMQHGNRGSNENSNSLLREFFPKKTNLAKVTIDKLTEALMLIKKQLTSTLMKN